MAGKPVSESSTVPYLLKMATAREGGPRIPGHYDAAEQVWMIATPDGPRPLIVAGRHAAELGTKTKVEAEQDDETLVALELTTKTSFEIESDDISSSVMGSLIELMTKTLSEPERDDQ